MFGPRSISEILGSTRGPHHHHPSVHDTGSYQQRAVGPVVVPLHVQDVLDGLADGGVVPLGQGLRVGSFGDFWRDKL